jgi:lipoate-protein ligase B
MNVDLAPLISIGNFADMPTDWEQLSRSSSTLEVFLLGKVDFEAAQALQARLSYQVAERQDSHGIVLICEHPPVISIGREGSFADVLVEPEELTARQTEIRWQNRGGGTFAHVPGQVAVYVIVPLERLKLTLADFVQRLEQSLIGAAADLDVDAEPARACPGACSRCGQFAFIGAAVRDGVTHGGMYVNVSMPPEAIDLVRWTNGAVRVTSLAAQRTRPTAMPSVRASLIRHVAEELGYEGYHLYTGHPLLQRSTRKVYVYA